jgi:CubicO group peptidase (beta-lactamase class C family)
MMKNRRQEVNTIAASEKEYTNVEDTSLRRPLSVWLLLDQERIYTRNLENPSGGGIGTARAIATAYSVFATGGHELGLRQETLQALMAPAIPPLHGFYDEVMKKQMTLSLGFLKPCPTYPYGNPGAFGSPGSGGSFAFADPQAGIGYAYVTNRMGEQMGGDPRDLALRAVFMRVISQPTTQTGDFR